LNHTPKCEENTLKRVPNIIFLKWKYSVCPLQSGTEGFSKSC
jgi:hypothetical protein